MRSTLQTALVAVLAGIGCAPAPTPGPPADTPPEAAEAEEQVRRTELARFEAQVRRDTVALDSLLAEDLVYTHSNALIESKAHFLETIATDRIRYDSIAPAEMRHRVFGEAAVGNGRVHVRVQMNGQTIPVDLLFTTVHVRRDGHWQLVAWQSTRAQ
ncbi:MAG: nuclear transport factor 2 family protein [Gemmatimonadales bacterium]